jgi:hypothetical protein
VTTGDVLLVLQQAFPAAATAITPAQYAAIAAAGVASYIEMPAILPGDPTTTYAPSLAGYYHRLVAYTDAMAGVGLPHLALLQAQGDYFLDYPPVALYPSTVLGYASVAGVDTAVFGLPPVPELNPVLFFANASTPGVPVPIPAPGGANATGPAAGTMLIGAIMLSCPVSSRFSPPRAWVALWNFILGTLTGDAGYAAVPSWTELVAPTMPQAQAREAARAALAAPASRVTHDFSDMLATALMRATDWLAVKSGLLTVDDPVPRALRGRRRHDRVPAGRLLQPD